MRMDEIEWGKMSGYYNCCKVYHKEYGRVTIFKDLPTSRYPGPYCMHISNKHMKYFDNIVDFAFHVALCEPLTPEGNEDADSRESKTVR